MPPLSPKHPPPPATQGRPSYPYTIHRMYLCGHPSEYIMIDKEPNTNSARLMHTIVPQPRVLKGISVRLYRQTRERCLACAKLARAVETYRLPAGEQEIRGDRVENGFLHVLRRERFCWRGERGMRIQWPEEREGDAGNEEYVLLKKVVDGVEAGRSWIPHARVPYEDRVGRRTVRGPAWEGEGKLAYVLQTAVHEALVEGLGHELFSDEEGERPESGGAVGMSSPSVRTMRSLSNTRVSPVPRIESSPRSPRSVQQARSRSRTNESPQPGRPATPPQSPQSSRSNPQLSREDKPRSHTYITTQDQDEVSRNRALALQHLEGRTHPTGERHSDTTPQTSQQRPPPPLNSPQNVPSYISHQRPFGPTRPSGGTTLSYGDQPRPYNSRSPHDQHQMKEPGVSISSIMQTLCPLPSLSSSPRSSHAQEEEQGGGRAREGSYGSYRSYESQRHPESSARVRSRGSRGSTSSFGSQRHARVRGSASRGSFASVGERVEGDGDRAGERRGELFEDLAPGSLAGDDGGWI